MLLVPENRIAGLSGKINEDKEISNIVDKAKKFTKVEGNEEVLMSLEPDLIIVADWLSKRITDIEAITGAKVYFYKTPNNYEEQKKLGKRSMRESSHAASKMVFLRFPCSVMVLCQTTILLQQAMSSRQWEMWTTMAFAYRRSLRSNRGFKASTRKRSTCS